MTESNLDKRNDQRSKHKGATNRTNGIKGETRLMEEFKKCLKKTWPERIEVIYKRRLSKNIKEETEECDGKYEDNHDFDVEIWIDKVLRIKSVCEVIKKCSKGYRGRDQSNDEFCRPKVCDLRKIIENNLLFFLGSRIGCDKGKFIICTPDVAKEILTKYNHESIDNIYGGKKFCKLNDYYPLRNGLKWISFNNVDKKELGRQIRLATEAYKSGKLLVEKTV